MNNSRLFRLSRIVIALTAASGMMVNTANAKEEAKAATQYTQQINQNYAKSLPFSDRQDFDDAQRGFIAPLLDEGILRDANGKVYYRADDYKFDINAAAPETVNPSLWRQSQINGISGLFKVTDKMYQVRGQDISNVTFVEGEKGIIVIDPLVTPPAAKAALHPPVADAPDQAGAGDRPAACGDLQTGGGDRHIVCADRRSLHAASCRRANLHSLAHGQGYKHR